MRRRTFLTWLGGAAACRPAWGAAPNEGRIVLAPPTEGQPVLDGSAREGVFMDTGTGRPESGMFGNVRRFADGSPRFHEGIDIAPARPWRRDNDPTDVVRAAADGVVAYVNRHGANPSLYGNYAVLTHPVPGFGAVYTLYAHLRAFAKGLRAGLRVSAGTPLGVMGHTPDFPLARAHLHFEIGLVMNVHYPLIDPQHGIWNGANLYGIDPSLVAQSASFTVAAGTFPDEVVMVEAVSDEAVATIQEKLQSRLDQVLVQSQSYDAENYKAAQSCRTASTSLPLVLGLSSTRVFAPS